MNYLMQTIPTKNQGFSLVIVVIQIALVIAIILPMAKVVVVEEKISQNYDWINMAYANTRGELFQQSSAEQVPETILAAAMENNTAQKQSLADDQTTALEFVGNNGIPYGFSLENFHGFQFEVVTQGDTPTTASVTQQKVGITYVAKKN